MYKLNNNCNHLISRLDYLKYSFCEWDICTECNVYLYSRYNTFKNIFCFKTKYEFNNTCYYILYENCILNIYNLESNMSIEMELSLLKPFKIKSFLFCETIEDKDIKKIIDLGIKIIENSIFV